MRKYRIIIPLCALFVILAGAVYFFQFTYRGQLIIYDLFGGNNLHLVSGDKELYWYDAWHRNNPNATIFRRIENALMEFDPDLILVEGGYDIFEGGRDEAISNGESAFTTYLGRINGIAVEDIEPPFISQIEYLQSKYPSDDIFAMYIIRQVSSWHFIDENSGIDFESELVSFSQFLMDNGLKWTGESFQDILNTVNSFLPQPITGDSWRDVDIREMELVYTKESGVLYPIYNDIYTFRNIYLLDFIAEKKNTYDRIFIVMGGQHLIDTQEQLSNLYSD